MQDEVIVRIAAKHGRSAARYPGVASGEWVLGHRRHRMLSILTDNVAALDLTLDDEDMAAIEALDDPAGQLGPEPNAM